MHDPKAAIATLSAQHVCTPMWLVQDMLEIQLNTNLPVNDPKPTVVVSNEACIIGMPTATARDVENE